MKIMRCKKPSQWPLQKGCFMPYSREEGTERGDGMGGGGGNHSDLFGGGPEEGWEEQAGRRD